MTVGLKKLSVHLIYIIFHYLWLSTQQIYFIPEISFKTQEGILNKIKIQSQLRVTFKLLDPLQTFKKCDV